MATAPHPQPTADRAADAGPPDAELLARYARGGDERAFEALVRRHGPRVFGVCRRVLGDAHAAEDAFQATFLVLARRAASIARPEALAGWLHGVAVRVARKARRARPEPLPEDWPAAGGGHDPDHRDLLRVLEEELARLPAADRDLLVLVYFAGRTHADAGRAVGCPAGSVAWRLARVRTLLRGRLVRRGVALGVGLVLMLAWVGAAPAVPEPLVQRAVAAARKRRKRRHQPVEPAADAPPAHPAPAGRRPRVVPVVVVVLVAALLGGGVFAAIEVVRPPARGADPPADPPRVDAAGNCFDLN